jgi:hypothetical protein
MIIWWSFLSVIMSLLKQQNLISLENLSFLQTSPTSRSTITRKIDAKIIKVKEDLKADINADISEHKTIAITSDGGRSGDLNKTKKNTLTVRRITEDFCLKTDVISLPEAK